MDHACLVARSGGGIFPPHEGMDHAPPLSALMRGIRSGFPCKKSVPHARDKERFPL
jgi:hypothetical protein